MIYHKNNSSCYTFFQNFVSSSVQIELNMEVLLYKLKLTIIATILSLSFSNSVFGFVNSKQVMEYFSKENLRPYAKTYINGVGSGIMWSNAMLEFDGRQKLFCKPDKKIFDFGRWYFEIFADEFLSNPQKYEEMPPAVPLLKGIISSFPCPNQ